MPKFDFPEYERQGPVIQMVPLIDILFFTLIFFMSLSVFYQQEAELNITVPKATQAKDTLRTPGQIIININRDGQFIVNQQTLSIGELEDMLKRVATLFPNQPVIIRADEKTYHQFVVKVLDACAKADIWDISIATMKVE